MAITTGEGQGLSHKKTSIHIRCNPDNINEAIVLTREQYIKEKRYQDYINDGDFEMLIDAS